MACSMSCSSNQPSQLIILKIDGFLYMYVVGVIGHIRYPVIYNRARLTPLFGKLARRPYPSYIKNQ